MDDFFQQSMSYDDAIREVQEEQQKQLDRMRKVRLSLYVGSLFVLVVTYLIFSQTNINFEFFLLALGIVVLIVLIVVIATNISMKNKLRYKYLNDVIIQLYNQEHEINLIYDYNPKVHKDFNVRMGLYTRFATVSTMYRIRKSEPHPFTILRSKMITSNGKSSQTHFDGLYVMIPVKGINRMQIRSKGKPRVAGIKMDKLEDYEEGVFVPRDSTNPIIPSIFVDLFRDLGRTFDLKQYVIGSNTEEVHVALWFDHLPSMPKELDYESFQLYKETFDKILGYVVELTHRLEEYGE